MEARNEVSELLLLLQYLKVNNNKTICYEFVPNVVHILKRGLFENSGGILYAFSWNTYILLFNIRSGPMPFQVAALAMEDMLSWMQEGGQVRH